MLKICVSVRMRACTCVRVLGVLVQKSVHVYVVKHHKLADFCLQLNILKVCNICKTKRERERDEIAISINVMGTVWKAFQLYI